MSFNLVEPVLILNPELLDKKAGPYSGSTESIAKSFAVAGVPSGIRQQGQEVVLIISGSSHKYIWRDGVADGDLVPLNVSLTSGDITTALGFTPENPANRNIANGYAGLDSGGHIPLTLFPAAALGNVKYKGTYDGTTVSSADSALNGNPLPTSDDSIQGYYFKVTTSFTLSGIDYNLQDWIICNGTAGGWQKVDNTDSVSTVFGRSGNIVANAGDYTTAQVSEDASHLYFTNARARTALSATGPIFYNSSTGVISSQAASASQSGYVTNGLQTFGGSKTFTDTVNVSKTGVTTIGNLLVGPEPNTSNEIFGFATGGALFMGIGNGKLSIYGAGSGNTCTYFGYDGTALFGGDAWNVSSGVNVKNILSLTPSLSTTGGTNTLRGVYYNMTYTTMTGTTNIAWENVNGDVLFGTTSGGVAIGTSAITAGSKLTVSGIADVTGKLSVGGATFGASQVLAVAGNSYVSGNMEAAGYISSTSLLTAPTFQGDPTAFLTLKPNSSATSANSFVIDNNGLTYGGGASLANHGIVVRRTITNPGAITVVGLRSIDSFTATTTTTPASTYGSIMGLGISASNTQNWSGSMNGMLASVAITSGATGVLSKAISGQFGVSNSASGFTITTAIGGIFNSIASTVGTTTNATDILYGTSTLPTGYWGLYNGGGRNNYLGAGNTLINSTTDDAVNKLQVNGYAIATGYKTPGGTSTSFLKADGSIDPTSYITASALTPYLLLSGGTITGATTFQALPTISYSGANLKINNTASGGVGFGTLTFSGGGTDKYSFNRSGGGQFQLTDIVNSINVWGYDYNSGNPDVTFNTNTVTVNNLIANGTIKTNGYNVASLPAGSQGMRAFVFNALSPTFGSAVVGGGTVITPVFHDGSNWIVG
jgi:hypothetical protein